MPCVSFQLVPFIQFSSRTLPALHGTPSTLTEMGTLSFFYNYGNNISSIQVVGIKNPSIYSLVESGMQERDCSINSVQIAFEPFGALLDAKRPPRCSAPSWSLGWATFDFFREV